jgi:Fe-S cluster biosynthesis and repair protein YggX
MINLIPSDPPVLSSSAYLEIKPGKWEKRYLFLKRQNIYISKNKSPSGATILCNLSTFDAYTLTTKRKNPPYSFCIALKSQDSILIFEKPERDYVNYLSFENKIILKNWLYAIYYSRNISIWEDRPEDECLFVPPKYRVDSDEITTLEFDQGQFSELDPTLPFKARIKAQKEATSKLRFVKQLFGANEKKLEINTKPDSEVFKKGSLLDGTHSPSSGDSSDSKSTESDSIFASGSLLSRSSSTKVKPAKVSEATNGPLVDPSTPTPFLNGSLLDNAAQLQESKQTSQRRNGPLIDASTPKHFLEGSLLDSSNSTQRDKHRTLPHNHMINHQAILNAYANPMTNNSLQSSGVQSNVSQRHKYRSMVPTGTLPHVNLNTPDAATAPQVPVIKSSPSRKDTAKAAKYQSMLPTHRAEPLIVKPKNNLSLQNSQNSSNYEEMQNSRSLGMGTNIYQNASHPVQPLAHNNANTDKYDTALSKLTRNQSKSISPTNNGKIIYNTISSPNDNRYHHHQSILTKHQQQGTIHPISTVNNSILQTANQPTSNTKSQKIKFEVKPLVVKKQTNITNTTESKRISSMGINSRLTKSQPNSPDIGSIPKYQGIPNDFQLRRAISTSTGNQFNRRQAPLVNLKD